MARLARIVAPGCWHHVTQRGNRRQTVFFDDTDRAMYLRLLVRHCRATSVGISGYCLLGNHVHLIAVPTRETGLSRALGRTHNDYARWSNLRRGETGHVWQNRFYSCPLDERHRWEALRYVELNPVRAGLAPEAEGWPWSSAAAHLAGMDRTGILDLTEWGEHWTAGMWRDALEQGVEDAALLEQIRRATRTGRPAGDEEFVGELEARFERTLRPQKRGPKIKVAAAGSQLELGVS
ncbi:MAG: transposase [Bryobacteraceae bacterium]|jgi:putative transposase